MDAERTRLKKTLRGRSTSAVGGEILQWGVHSVSFSLSSKLEHSEAAAGVIIGVCASDLDPTVYKPGSSGSDEKEDSSDISMPHTSMPHTSMPHDER